MKGQSRELRRWRRLPIPGEVLVCTGQEVTAGTLVARYRQPGPSMSLNISGQLDLPAADVPRSMTAEVGDRIADGQVIARTRSFLGFGGGEYRAKRGGRLVSVSGLTGQAVIEGAGEILELEAWLPGVVGDIEPDLGVEIVSRGLRLPGIFGVGGEVSGLLRRLVDRDETLTEKHIALAGCGKLEGAVLVGGASVTLQGLRAATDAGAVALLTGGLDDIVLRDFLGTDVDAQDTGGEISPLTIVLTSGFGTASHPDALWGRLCAAEGRTASVSGQTRLRAGVRRPEILIPLRDDLDGTSREEM